MGELNMQDVLESGGGLAQLRGVSNATSEKTGQPRSLGTILFNEPTEPLSFLCSVTED